MPKKQTRLSEILFEVFQYDMHSQDGKFQKGRQKTMQNCDFSEGRCLHFCYAIFFYGDAYREEVV